MADSMLTRFYLLDEGFCAFNLKYLFFVGLWPEEYFTRKQRVMYRIFEFTLHLLTIIFLVITGIGTYQKKDDIILLLTNLDKGLLAYNFFSKTIIFTMKRPKLRNLIYEIDNSGDEITDDRKIFMAKYIIYFTCLSTIVVGAFSMLAIFEGEMTIEAWMPFDPMENKMKLVLSAQVLAVTFVPCLCRAFAMQGFICSIIMYLCDQLIDLQNTIRNLKYTVSADLETRMAFKEIIKTHVRLMGYSKSMETIFKEYFLIQNQAVSVELCLNAIMISIVGVHQKTLLITFVAYLCLALINAYIYCYLGNELIIQSQDIALAAYESSWTSWPVSLQKDLLILIRAAQRPLKMSSGGMAAVSIETFSQALYNGYSIFAVLNDVVK